jgi:hypothetical protein
VLASLAALASAPDRFARSSRRRSSARPISRASTSSDYDVRLVLPDTGAFLRGDVTVTARGAPSATRLRLDLVDSMHVRTVDVNGARVRATHAGNSLDVPLPSGAGDRCASRVVYDGSVTTGWW